LIVGQSLQGVYGICFYIDQKKLGLELLIEVSPGLKGKDTSVCFLPEEVFGPFHSLVSFKKLYKVQELRNA